MVASHDCKDGFLCAYRRRPEAYLDPNVRSAISTLARVGDYQAGLTRLGSDLTDGSWHRKICFARRPWIWGTGWSPSAGTEIGQFSQISHFGAYIGGPARRECAQRRIGFSEPVGIAIVPSNQGSDHDQKNE